MSAVTLALMGQQGTLKAPGYSTGMWLQIQGAAGAPAAEVLDEGDGNILIRSSFNRDRTLRLTWAELQQLVAIYHGALVGVAPEVVTGG